jgi:hypothetical protein
VEAKGSSDSESGISKTCFEGVLRRRGVAGAGSVLRGDLARFGEAGAFVFVVRFVGAAASFLGLPRGRFSTGGPSISTSLLATDFRRRGFTTAGASAMSETDAAESFLGLPRGRFSGCGTSFPSPLTTPVFFFLFLVGDGGSAASVVAVAESFLGRPLGREGEAAAFAVDVDMVAWVDMLPEVILFRLSQHWVKSAIIAVLFFITLKPYDATSFASRASV